MNSRWVKSESVLDGNDVDGNNNNHYQTLPYPNPERALTGWMR